LNFIETVVASATAALSNPHTHTHTHTHTNMLSLSLFSMTLSCYHRSCQSVSWFKSWNRGHRDTETQRHRDTPSNLTRPLSFLKKGKWDENFIFKSVWVL